MVKRKDLKGLEFNENLTSFDVLVAVARIALTKFNKKEKKKQMLMIQRSPQKNSVPKETKIRIKLPNLTKNPIKNPLFLDHKTCLETQFECKREKEKAVKAKKKRTKNSDASTGPHPPPDMPLEFKNIIAAKGGSEITLVIQKGLYQSDVSIQHNRLSVPVNLALSDFLTEEEKGILESHKGKNCEGITCDFIEPSMEETVVTLKRWNMNSPSYVLITTWNGIVERNRLEEKMIVQLWSFRVNSNLCFALVHLPEQV